jgi:hypothetical protein
MLDIFSTVFPLNQDNPTTKDTSLTLLFSERRTDTIAHVFEVLVLPLQLSVDEQNSILLRDAPLYDQPM